MNESGKVNGPGMPIRTVGLLESLVITSSELITCFVARRQA